MVQTSKEVDDTPGLIEMSAFSRELRKVFYVNETFKKRVVNI